MVFRVWLLRFRIHGLGFREREITYVDAGLEVVEDYQRARGADLVLGVGFRGLRVGGGG